VQAGQWYYEEIAKSLANGAIDGYPDNTFRPNNSMTREEAVTVIGRALDLEELDGSTEKFTDTNRIQEYAKGYINAVTEKGYIQGYPNGEFKPQNAITRGETACIVYNILMDREEPTEPEKITNAVYLGVKDYNTVDASEKDNFEHKFSVDGNEKIYKVSNKEDYALNNILAEGYVFDLTIDENNLIIDVAVPEPSVVGTIESMTSNTIEVNGNV